jgi:hypothetical protein
MTKERLMLACWTVMEWPLLSLPPLISSIIYLIFKRLNYISYTK